MSKTGTPEETALVNFLNRSRPTKFYDPKFIPMGIRETPTSRRAKKNAAKPGYFFSQISESGDETSLSKLFNQQADRLMDIQFDKYVQVSPKVFWAHINKLADLVNTIKPKKDCIPFLIVVTEYTMNRQKQASRLGIDCMGGGSRLLDKGKMPDMPGIDRPQLPYLAVNVNIGTKFSGLSPAAARKKFNRWWRWNKLLPLTVDEGFALEAQFPEIIKNNIIDLIGTQFGANGVPGLMQKDDGPWIVRRSDDQEGIGRLPAFCHDRLAPKLDKNHK